MNTQERIEFLKGSHDLDDLLRALLGYPTPLTRLLYILYAK